MQQTCPLKPGVKCEATYNLAESSRCIGCPLLDQCDQALLYCNHKRGGGPDGCIGILVNEEACA